MKKIVQDDFEAQIGIWGSVERAPGAEGERYDLVIKCVDFSAQPRPKVIFETTARTKSVSEIPHVYVKQMLDALYGRKPALPPSPDLAAEENWRKNPNLVIGDFEQGADGVPKGWDSRCAPTCASSAPSTSTRPRRDRVFSGVKCHPMGALETVVAREEVDLAILCVPAGEGPGPGGAPGAGRDQGHPQFLHGGPAPAADHRAGRDRHRQSIDEASLLYPSPFKGAPEWPS